jgi:predicted metalloprotease with PDZ domain
MIIPRCPSHCLLIVTLSIGCILLCSSFSSFTISSFSKPPTRVVAVEQQTTSTRIYSKEDDESATNDDKLDSNILSKIQSQPNLKSNLLYTYNITTHKPSLGFTIEESLVEGSDGEKFIFISKVTQDGIAARNGLQVGDLIVGVSGTFESVEDVFGQSLDRV